MLKKNGMSVKDVKIVNLEPQPAANAMIAGTAGIDAAMTYEPYLSAVRAKPEAGKIIATTLDYPMIMDTFGCVPKFLADNPKAAKAIADSYFEAVEMISKEPKRSFEIMGADVKQSGEAFEASQKYLRWQDRAANLKFFSGEHAQFSKEAADLLLEAGIIKRWVFHSLLFSLQCGHLPHWGDTFQRRFWPTLSPWFDRDLISWSTKVLALTLA
jgi:NitT/TauT family transport system substrate-binding protein